MGTKKVNPFSDDISKVLQYASNSALKKGQTYLNTAGVFDGVLRLCALKPELSELNAKIKLILGRYCINSNAFNDAYALLFPVSEELDKNISVVPSDDVNNVLSSLNITAQREKRVQSVEDLLAQLFSDKSYKLFFVFSKIADTMNNDYDAAVDNGVPEDQLPPRGFDVNILYADMQKLLAAATVKEIRSLETEEMKKYLTNINKFVASRSDLKLIGMENELHALEVALAGRTCKSAVLVGPPGTGKTSIVWELADRINNGDSRVPLFLKDTIIYEMHMDALVAGKLVAPLYSNI